MPCGLNSSRMAESFALQHRHYALRQGWVLWLTENPHTGEALADLQSDHPQLSVPFQYIRASIGSLRNEFGGWSGKALDQHLKSPLNQVCEAINSGVDVEIVKASFSRIFVTFDQIFEWSWPERYTACGIRPPSS